VLVLVFFFLPWVSVSCSGSKMIEMSGYELAAGKDIGFGETTEPDELIFLVPLAAIAAALITFGTKSPVQMRLAQVICALVGLGVLGLKWMAMQDANTYDLTISTEYGLWGTIAGFLLLFISAAVVVDEPVSGPSPGEIDDYLNDLRQQTLASARADAARSLRKIEDPPERVISALREVALSDSSPFVRAEATLALRYMGYRVTLHRVPFLFKKPSPTQPASTSVTQQKPRCPNGHGELPPQSKFCHICGAQVEK
jgi:hypothetical protein